MSASLQELLAVSALVTAVESAVSRGRLPPAEQISLTIAIEAVRRAFGIAPNIERSKQPMEARR